MINACNWLLPVLWCRHHVGCSMRGTLLSAALLAVMGQVCVHDVGQVANGEDTAFCLGVGWGTVLHGHNCSVGKNEWKLGTGTLVCKEVKQQHAFVSLWSDCCIRIVACMLFGTLRSNASMFNTHNSCQQQGKTYWYQWTTFPVRIQAKNDYATPGQVCSENVISQFRSNFVSTHGIYHYSQSSKDSKSGTPYDVLEKSFDSCGWEDLLMLRAWPSAVLRPRWSSADANSSGGLLMLVRKILISRYFCMCSSSTSSDRKSVNHCTHTRRERKGHKNEMELWQYLNASSLQGYSVLYMYMYMCTHSQYRQSVGAIPTQHGGASNSADTNFFSCFPEDYRRVVGSYIVEKGKLLEILIVCVDVCARCTCTLKALHCFCIGAKLMLISFPFNT